MTREFAGPGATTPADARRDLNIPPDDGAKAERAADGRRTFRKETEMSKVGASDTKNTLYCSFCGKSQHEVRKLIAGPTVFICDECVELCMDIIRE